MEQILEKLEELPNWKEKMRSACKKNNLCTSIASNLTILKIKMLGDRFRRSYETLKDRISAFWIENQLRAFTWIAVAVSALCNRPILQFKEDQWNEIGQIFYTKKLTYLKFEARKLVESNSKKNINWSLQQEKILTDLVNEASQLIKDNQKIQWNEIAHKMFCISEQRIFRNGKHCRQHWLNYLDPSKQRGAWTIDEDIYLTEKVIAQGKKWSEYAAYLKRTEHTVKNRFNSLVIKQKKLSPQIKKQQRLYKQLSTRLLYQKSKNIQKQQNSCRQQGQSQEIKCSNKSSQSLENIEKKENILQQKQQQQDYIFPQKELSKQENISQKIQMIQEQIPEKKQQIQVINPLSNYPPPTLPPNACIMSDLNFCIKQERQTNRTIFTEYPLYSPYSSYIISPNTPNYLSPGQAFVNNNFLGYFHTFMNITDMRWPLEKEKKEGNQ